MILRQATIRYKGYDPEDLKPQSNKRVCVSCDKCGRVRWLRKSMYRDLCVSCSRKTPERRKLTIEMNKNRPPISEETRQKMRNSHLGKHLSEEHKRKLSAASKDRTYTKERNEKLSNSKKGITFTKEHRIKLSCAKQCISPNDWDGFAKEQKYCSKFNNQLKEQIRNKYNRKCFLCDKSEENNGQRLSVHHVDLNKDQGCNGYDWKLVPLCQSCHSRCHNDLWQNRIEYLINY